VISKIKKILLCIFNPQYINAYLLGICPLFELEKSLNNIKKIDNLIDIGSNKGQFALIVKNKFKNCQIISFEPQNEFLNIQKKLFIKNTKFYNFCLGSINQIKKIYILNRADSSSLLKPIIIKNKYKIIKRENVYVKKLDDVIKFKANKTYFMKIDVQGYEYEVLKGAKNSLKFIKYILIEVSNKKFYYKQKHKKKLLSFLKKNKFVLKKKLNFHKVDKKNYQYDCLFGRG